MLILQLRCWELKRLLYNLYSAMTCFTSAFFQYLEENRSAVFLSTLGYEFIAMLANLQTYTRGTLVHHKYMLV